MQTKQINEIFQILSQTNPEPKTELVYENHYTLLVSVVLSAQATDKSVNNATKNLFIHYNSPEKMLELGLDGLKQYIKTIGLFNSKAKNVIELSKILVQKYHSQVPDNFDDLILLPGVGRKTANVVLNCAFGKPTMPVDTHVYRVARRIGLADGATPEKVERQLLKAIPKKWMKFAHHWLILHGRYICRAKKPLCEKCSVQKYCKYYNEGLYTKK